MNDLASLPGGLMVLSAWVELGGRLRVRITRTDDVQSGDSIDTYAASASEVLEAVDAWLESVLTRR